MPVPPVIPARYAYSLFPSKAPTEIGGATAEVRGLIQRMWKAQPITSADRVAAATDNVARIGKTLNDQRIA